MELKWLSLVGLVTLSSVAVAQDAESDDDALEDSLDDALEDILRSDDSTTGSSDEPAEDAFDDFDDSEIEDGFGDEAEVAPAPAPAPVVEPEPAPAPAPAPEADPAPSADAQVQLDAYDDAMDDLEDAVEEVDDAVEQAELATTAYADELSIEPPPRRAAESDNVAPGYADIEVKSRKLPIYPDSLKVLYDEQAIRCEADVWIDDRGAPMHIAMVDCPDGFHLAALSAMAKWRWEKPEQSVPSTGLKVRARTGFTRKDRRYYPGVTYFRSPEEVTADGSLPVMLKSGKMPKFPAAVRERDDVCLVEIVVNAAGKSTDVIVDECARPYRLETLKVIKGWTWWWTVDHDKDDTQSVITEIVFRI